MLINATASYGVDSPSTQKYFQTTKYHQPQPQFQLESQLFVLSLSTKSSARSLTASIISIWLYEPLNNLIQQLLQKKVAINSSNMSSNNYDKKTSGLVPLFFKRRPSSMAKKLPKATERDLWRKVLQDLAASRVEAAKKKEVMKYANKLELRKQEQVTKVEARRGELRGGSWFRYMHVFMLSSIIINI